MVGLIAAGGGYLLWKQHEAAALPKGIVGINGRLEATQVDIATKIAGRVIEIVPQEGDMVSVGSVVARLDKAELEAQLQRGNTTPRGLGRPSLEQNPTFKPGKQT